MEDPLTPRGASELVAASGGPRPVVVVSALSAMWLAIAASTLLVSPEPAALTPQVPTVVLAALFAYTQSFVVHVQLRREARSVFLSEIPMLVGLLHATGSHLLLARVLGAAVGFGLLRKQFRQPQKLVFNVTLAAAECVVAEHVLRMLFAALPAPAAELSSGAAGRPVLWACALAATCVSSGFAGVGVGLVIHLLEARLRLLVLLRLAAAAAALALPVAVVGVVVSAAWHDTAWSALPLAVTTLLMMVGYRAYSGLNERHAGLERLYQFSQAVSSAPGIDDVLRGVLQQARELAHAEQARITFLDSGGPALEVVLDAAQTLRRGPVAYLADSGAYLDVVVGRGEPVLLERGSRDPAARAWLAARDLRDCVMVPLPGESGPVAVLAVDDRLGDVRGFSRAEVKLLQTVAHQAAVALRNGQLVEQLRHESLHDPLTDLPNRTLFARELEVRLAEREGDVVAVGIVDLDAFKDVNDTLGHTQGDELLREVAARLLTAVGPSGLVARLGGDEFAVLLAGCADQAEAERWGTGLLHAFDAPVELAGIQVGVSASLGLAVSGPGSSSAPVLLKQADLAMYDAKHLGCGVQLFRPDLDTASPSRLALVSQLRRAVEAGEIEVFVQPKVDAQTGRPVGSEALARWRHAERGMVPPDEFIPLAERSGLIAPLTALVLTRAVLACVGWQDVGPGVGVSVNISARSLYDDTVVDLVDHLLLTTGLVAQLLTLEITESNIMADPARTLGVLHRLRERGVRLSVDDFGTGYSSLSYLRRLPVSEVKVDRSFVQRMTEQSEDAAIVTSIVELGRTLGLSVVAEGVEDEATWTALRTLGCDELQGWVIAHPMPVAQVPGWLCAWRPPVGVSGLVPSRVGPASRH